MKFGLVSLALFVALAAPGCDGMIASWDVVAEGSFERVLKVTGAVDLDVSTGSGHINVRTGDATSVRITGRIKVYRASRSHGEEKVRLLESNPPVEQTGNIIRIGRIDDRELREHVSISYDLVVPSETRLRGRTGSGSQTVEGIRGPADVDTGSGSLTISRISDEVKARTGSGEIRLDAVEGLVDASTGSGSIRATGVARGLIAKTGSGEVNVNEVSGNVEVRTGSGSIEVEGLRGSLRAHTGSGGIVAQGAPGGEWNLDTSSGSISVKLPAEAAFDLDARASSGSISMGHPLTLQGTIRKNELHGKVRGGGHLLYVRTGSGTIQIE